MPYAREILLRFPSRSHSTAYTTAGYFTTSIPEIFPPHKQDSCPEPMAFRWKYQVFETFTRVGPPIYGFEPKASRLLDETTLQFQLVFKGRSEIGASYMS